MGSSTTSSPKARGSSSKARRTRSAHDELLASKSEVLSYYASVLDGWRAAGHDVRFEGGVAFDFDAAAWDLWDMARSLLVQLEADDNLLKLPAGALRVLQLGPAPPGAWPKPDGNRGSSGWLSPGTPIGVDAVPGPRGLLSSKSV